jgi:hypothetical protein
MFECSICLEHVDAERKNYFFCACKDTVCESCFNNMKRVSTEKSPPESLKCPTCRKQLPHVENVAGVSRRRLSWRATREAAERAQRSTLAGNRFNPIPPLPDNFGTLTRAERRQIGAERLQVGAQRLAASRLESSRTRMPGMARYPRLTDGRRHRYTPYEGE